VPCSNAAKTRNPLKFAGVPQTRQQISAVSRPKFTIFAVHVEEVLLFNKFFPIVDTCLSSEDIAQQNCAMVPNWRFFCILYLQRAACSTFPSDLHSKFALGPHHVWKYGRHQSAIAEIRREKKKERKKEDGKKPQGKNIMTCPIS